MSSRLLESVGANVRYSSRFSQSFGVKNTFRSSNRPTLAESAKDGITESVVSKHETEKDENLVTQESVQGD